MGGGIPHGSAGVHVAEDRLLIQRKYTAWSAAVLNKGEEDVDTFIILIRMLWMINAVQWLIKGFASNDPLTFPQ